MTCHESPDESGKGEHLAGLGKRPMVKSPCDCRDHRSTLAKDFVSAQVEPFTFQPLDAASTCFGHPENHLDSGSLRFQAPLPDRINARAAPDLTKLSRFLI